MAFHRYPQVIRHVFNRDRFGPLRGVSHASACPRIDRLVSGLPPATGRPIRTRFPYGFPVDRLTLPQKTTPRLILQEARRHPAPARRPEHRAPTGCRHTVSGSISLPFRGSFHLSLSVLVHYRSLRVFSLRRWSSQIHSGHHVSAATWEHSGETPALSLTGLLPSMARLSQTGSARTAFCNSLATLGSRLTGPTTPCRQRTQALAPARFGLFPLRSPLLGESQLLSFPPATELIQFAGLPPDGLCIQPPVTLHDERQVSPFGHPRVKGSLHLTGALSLLATPFIGSQRLGIHRTPFVA